MMGLVAVASVEQRPVGVRAGTAQGRWVLAAVVLGSGMAFLDGTVVNVALPSIGTDLDMSLVGLQWTVNSYLLTLSALVLLGGSLSDRFGRRLVFVVGLGWFSAASVLCGLAPSSEMLLASRALQGVGGALLVPGSLAIIAATFHPDDRSRAIGAWSGLAGVASALGPFLGGWLIDAVSWRLVFLINVPLGAAAIAISLRHVPETRSAKGPLDLRGAALITLALTGLSYAVIDHRAAGSLVAAVAGAVSLLAFVVVERRSPAPMLPLEIFRSRQFTGTNLTTLAVYAGLGGSMFLLVLRLQSNLGYSALEAGAALLPFTVLLLVLSAPVGELASRIGARLPLTVGPVVAGVGILLLAELEPGDSYVAGVLPGVGVFGLGMSVTVAPLTAAVLGSVDDSRAGVASGVNNAVARLAGLVAVAVLPVLAGIPPDEAIAEGLDTGYATAMRIAALTTAAGGAAAFALVRRTADVSTPPLPSVLHPCSDPCRQRPVGYGSSARRWRRERRPTSRKILRR